jgi:AraC-like DNA-binding protein
MRELGDLIDARGMDSRTLFADAGITLPTATNFYARVSTEQVSRLWEIVVERSGDPSIALKLAPKRPLPSFDAVGYAMLSSPSLLAGLERLSRFLSVVSSAAEAVLQYRGTKVALLFSLDGGTSPIPPQRYEFDLLCFIEFFRWIMNSDLRSTTIEMIHTSAVPAGEYADAFRCPVRFACPSYAIVFDLHEAQAPVPTFNPALVDLHDSFLEECIVRLGPLKCTKRVRELVVRMLPEGEPQRAEVARLQSISERTLQRHLKAEGTSFNQILDDVRREMSCKYLRQRRLDLSEISCLLGFNGQSNFSRAFKRWFEMSPRQYRENLQPAERE